MKQLQQQIESLLFIAGKPLSVKKISEIVHAEPKDVEQALQECMHEYEQQERGLHIMKSGTTYQMATHPRYSNLVTEFIKSEQTGELTKPSLETLTIIAYRGPVSKTEIEQIRGVNCSLILRNLLIKGLIESSFDRTQKTTLYTVTLPFLEFLGVSKIDELPDYETLHSDERLQKLFRAQIEDEQPQTTSNDETE